MQLRDLQLRRGSRGAPPIHNRSLITFQRGCLGVG